MMKEKMIGIKEMLYTRFWAIVAPIYIVAQQKAFALADTTKLVEATNSTTNSIYNDFILKISGGVALLAIAIGALISMIPLFEEDTIKKARKAAKVAVCAFVILLAAPTLVDFIKSVVSSATGLSF